MVLQAPEYLSVYNCIECLNRRLRCPRQTSEIEKFQLESTAELQRTRTAAQIRRSKNNKKEQVSLYSNSIFTGKRSCIVDFNEPFTCLKPITPILGAVKRFCQKCLFLITAPCICFVYDYCRVFLFRIFHFFPGFWEFSITLSRI